MGLPFLTRMRRRARSLLLPAFVRLLATLPRGLAMAIGTLVGRVGWFVARGTRKLMVAHLGIAFPNKTLAEREAVARASFVHLAWVGAEMVSIRSYDARLEEYVSFAPGTEEMVRAALAKGRGLVFVTGHIGNWELMVRRTARAGIACAAIAKANADPKINAMFEAMRADGGFETLWRDDPKVARSIVHCFRNNKLLGILIDQDTRVQGVYVPFFGRLAFTPRAAGDLALRFRAPVIVGWSRRRGPRPGDGHVLEAVDIPFDMEATDRDAESLRITAACTAVLEAAIRQTPAEWVWMHRRWRHRPAEELAAPSAQA